MILNGLKKCPQVARFSKGHYCCRKKYITSKDCSYKRNFRSISIINSGEQKSFDVLSNPEFLAEGTAIKDLVDPDRVLIGGENKEAILTDFYLSTLGTRTKISYQYLE